MTQQSVTEESEREQKRLRLYLEQVKLLDTFLANGAITRAQYDKSFGDLTEKMGMRKSAVIAEK